MNSARHPRLAAGVICNGVKLKNERKRIEDIINKFDDAVPINMEDKSKRWCVAGTRVYRLESKDVKKYFAKRSSGPFFLFDSSSDALMETV